MISVDKIVTLAEVERRYILQVLEHYRGNRMHAAKALGIARNTLWRKLKQWEVPAARESGKMGIK